MEGLFDLTEFLDASAQRFAIHWKSGGYVQVEDDVRAFAASVATGTN